jgi:hypothetical protein
MQSRATTVSQYLAELPDDRRSAIEAVRAVILENLETDYEEGMQYGMIGYYVPHHVYPPGCHNNPKEPLPFINLASQTNFMTLHALSLYPGGDHLAWFQRSWAATGKKLDMGNCCIHFKHLDDLPLGLIAELVRRIPAKKYAERYASLINERSAAKAGNRARSAKGSRKSPSPKRANAPRA